MQLVVAARLPDGFSLVGDTVSELGAVASPGHATMNVTFVAIGAALALGGLAVALLAGRARRGVERTAGVLLVVAGISSLAVGLVPLDRDPDLHTLVALPVFVAQPLALLLLGVGLRRRHRALAGVLLVTGAVAALGAAAFGVTLDGGDLAGLWERIALWPCNLALALLGGAMVRARVWEDRPMEPAS